MTADQHLRMIIGDLMVKMAVLLEEQDTLTARVAELEAVPPRKKPKPTKAPRGD